MSDVRENVERFLEQYQAALANDDFETVAASYHDTFLFGLPQHVHVVPAKNFALAAKRRQEFRGKGLSQTRLKQVEVTSIDANYIQARATFEMHIQDATKDVRATYIIFDDGARLRIVLQIDHQDLAQELSEQR